MPRRPTSTTAPPTTELAAASALEDAINGTKLVLVLEVGDRCLLLPGDAEIGAPGGRCSPTPPGATLLARTDLYKVSHHGSYNGTPKPFVDTYLQPDATSLMSFRPVARFPVDTPTRARRHAGRRPPHPGALRPAPQGPEGHNHERATSGWRCACRRAFLNGRAPARPHAHAAEVAEVATTPAGTRWRWLYRRGLAVGRCAHAALGSAAVRSPGARRQRSARWARRPARRPRGSGRGPPPEHGEVAAR